MAFEDKKDLLSLFNAVNGTDYDDPEGLELITLENAIYLNYKNDVSYFVFRVRQLLKTGLSDRDAINRAMDECIEENRLKDVLMNQRSEVLGVLLSTFNKERYEQGLKDDAYQAGVADGLSEGALIILNELIKKKLEKGKSVEVIAEEVEQSVEYVKQLIAELDQKK